MARKPSEPWRRAGSHVTSCPSVSITQGIHGPLFPSPSLPLLQPTYPPIRPSPTSGLGYLCRHSTNTVEAWALGPWTLTAPVCGIRSQYPHAPVKALLVTILAMSGGANRCCCNLPASTLDIRRCPSLALAPKHSSETFHSATPTSFAVLCRSSPPVSRV